MSNLAINLLPDVRQERLRNEHMRKLVVTLAILIWAIAAGIVILLALAVGAQKLLITTYSSSISNSTAKINATAHLDDALSAQAALNTLPGLYSDRVFFSAFFNRLASETPNDVYLGSVTVDPTGLITASGIASSAEEVDKFYESLKAANASNPYYTYLDISSVTKDTSGKASFSMTASAAPSATADPAAVTNTTGVTTNGSK